MCVLHYIHVAFCLIHKQELYNTFIQQQQRGTDTV